MAHIRAKVVDGTVTAEELREGVRLMREDRFGALQAAANSASGRKKAAKAPVNVDNLFADLDKI
jgi:hypothetical protein